MSQHISQSQTRLAVENGKPIVIDVETALDEVYSALANERRRAVLRVLMRASVPMDLETTIAKVTEQEPSTDSGTESTDLQRRVRISLYHNHLPKLDDLGLIEFDPEERTIESVADTLSSAGV